MKAKYIKPEMDVSAIAECEMLCMSVSSDIEENSFDSKGRWVEDTDLWGNECWNYEED